MEAPSTEPYQLPSDAVWFITGCSSGIGEALANFLVSKASSNRVVATARNPASLSGIPDEPNALKHELDVTSIASVDAAFDAAVARFGRVDIVVNNAGYNIMGDTEAATDAESRALMDANFWGAVDVTKRALGVLRDDNAKGGARRGGVILFVSSFGGFCGSPGNAFYHASKFAMEGFAEAVAKEVDPAWNIHCCCVEPGGIGTKYLANLKMMEKRHPAYADPKMPTNSMLSIMGSDALLQSLAPPEDVAAAMYALVSRGRKIPMRIPLGSDSWHMIMAEIDTVRKDLEEWKELSCGVGNSTQKDYMDGLKNVM